MKQFILFVLVALMFSCGPIEKKEYRLHVIFSNGQEEIITFEGVGRNIFSLRNGDLEQGRTVFLSGVRSFTVKSIINKGPLSDEERNNENGCSCETKIVSTEKIIKNEEITE